ncbi:hypothetical protein DV096_08030 [Bradymonadaceae bacterium TMQ3]|uniref:CdiI immunity protein domain-containing protein n=1 Tax=Lujinxingia sediminis TaxID=2480984 RepID=A0ABY0CSQ7_9DELT|nr:hypothetical protein [Lujinxingia sediminis]RDV38743.1 hypothetical protein DV096_08030 [Bradymonadaceae bacterium TMQ3]RVU43979.1 hypothetical protein EA187_10465 [Lujinxingia sediminis]TXC76484.1 hypothetical protein FRC91_07045 [Bradymonadales bacterium TMQ1]
MSDDSSFEPFEILKHRLQNYANVNAYDLAALKSNLERQGNEEVRAIFWRELDATIAGDGVTRHAFEALTEGEFEDDADYVAFLSALRAYVFEGGPLP